jgi:hypothetical protein
MNSCLTSDLLSRALATLKNSRSKSIMRDIFDDFNIFL